MDSISNGYSILHTIYLSTPFYTHKYLDGQQAMAFYGHRFACLDQCQALFTGDAPKLHSTLDVNPYKVVPQFVSCLAKLVYNSNVTMVYR